LNASNFALPVREYLNAAIMTKDHPDRGNLHPFDKFNQLSLRDVISCFLNEDPPGKSCLPAMIDKPAAAA